MLLMWSEPTDELLFRNWFTHAPPPPPRLLLPVPQRQDASVSIIMLYAWLLFAFFYAATSLCTLWAITAGVGSERLAMITCIVAGLQVFRILPSGGFLGLPGEAVRWLNYYLVLTAYRMNYL